MSSILKALRKVGEEKRVDQLSAPDLRLDQGLAPVSPKTILPLLTGIALGALVVGLLFLWASRETAPVASVQPASESKPVVTASEEAADSASLANVAEQDKASATSLKELAESSRVSVVALSPEPVIQPKVLKPTIPTPPVKKQKAAEALTVVSTPSAPIQVLPEVAVVKKPLTHESELPEGVSLVVAEIFYQEDSSNSMAVVNDLPVMIGTHVDSAVVDEIRPESVLFMIKGKPYDVAVAKP